MEQAPQKTATFTEQELAAILQFLEANIPMSLGQYVNAVRNTFAQKLGESNGQETSGVHAIKRKSDKQSGPSAVK